MQLEDTLYYTSDKPKENISKLNKKRTILLIIDMQNEFVKNDYGDAVELKKKGIFEKWLPFYQRISEIVIPHNKELIKFFRQENMFVSYARIACFRNDGRDRSLVQRKTGWNDILLPRKSYGSQIISELTPKNEDIVVEKTTDSVVNGTSYVQLLHNLGIDTVVVTGVVTDQCVSTSVRDLADHGFNVIVAEDACAAATMKIHQFELGIMNHIYCEVYSTSEIIKKVSV